MKYVAMLKGLGTLHADALWGTQIARHHSSSVCEIHDSASHTVDNDGPRLTDHNLLHDDGRLDHPDLWNESMSGW